MAKRTSLLVGFKENNRILKIIATAFACIVFLIGASTLLEHLVHIDFKIDQLLAKELPGAAGTISPNRMGPIASLSFTLIGAGLLLMTWNHRTLASYMGSVVCIIVMVPAIGYLLKINNFYSLPKFTVIAWPTIIALLAIGLALILSRHGKGQIVMFFKNDPGGMLLQKMLPGILLIPLIFGMLIVNGQSLFGYDLITGIGILIIAMVLLLLLMAIRAARAMNITNSRKEIAEQELKDSEKKFRDLVINAPAGIYEIDFRTMKFTTVNDSMCLLTGYSRDEFLSMSPSELLDDAGKKAFQARINQWLSGEKPDENIDNVIKTKEGGTIYIEMNVKFKTDELGKPLGAMVVAHDIDLRNVEVKLKKNKEIAEKAIRDSEEKYRTLFEAIDEGFLYFRHDLRRRRRTCRL
jgi:two-component system, sporulation sensor kinase E